MPTLRLGMCDDARDSFAEIWTSAGPIRSGSFNDLVFAHDDDFLFCAGFIPASDRYTEATRQGLRHAFALVRRTEVPQDFPHVELHPAYQRRESGRARGLSRFLPWARCRIRAGLCARVGHAGGDGHRYVGRWRRLLFSGVPRNSDAAYRKLATDARVRVSAALRSEIAELRARHAIARYALRIRHGQHSRTRDRARRRSRQAVERGDRQYRASDRRGESASAGLARRLYAARISTRSRCTTGMRRTCRA